MKTIVFTHQAARELDALHDSVREQITSALVGDATIGQGDVSGLAGQGRGDSVFGSVPVASSSARIR